jgi:hypothetical protein
MTLPYDPLPPAEKARLEDERILELGARKLRLIKALREYEAFNEYFVHRLRERANDLQNIALRAPEASDRESARLRFLEVDGILKWLDEDEAGWMAQITNVQRRAQLREQAKH